MYRQILLLQYDPPFNVTLPCTDPSEMTTSTSAFHQLDFSLLFSRRLKRESNEQYRRADQCFSNTTNEGMKERASDEQQQQQQQH